LFFLINFQFIHKRILLKDSHW